MDESEAQAFLAAITEHPDDLRPRLVFADWLREQSAPALQDRGEFIHLQHSLAHDGTPPGEVLARSVARQRELLDRYRDEWDEPFTGMASSTEYRNGFAERLRLPSALFADHFAELVRLAPVIRVRLIDLASVSRVATAPAFAHLRELDLQDVAVSPGHLAALVDSPFAVRLRALNLRHTGIDDEGIRILVRSRVFPQLRYLNLADNGMSDAGGRTLHSALRGGRAENLQRLVLDKTTWRSFRELPPFPETLPNRYRWELSIQRDRVSLLDTPRDARESLSAELRVWVDGLSARGGDRLLKSLAALPLPDAVSHAMAAACRRRIVWRASRLKVAAPDVSATVYDLAALVDVLLGMTDPKKELASLTEILLDLYLRYERGTLRPDGKTRAAE